MWTLFSSGKIYHKDHPTVQCNVSANTSQCWICYIVIFALQCPQHVSLSDDFCQMSNDRQVILQWIIRLHSIVIHKSNFLLLHFTDTGSHGWTHKMGHGQHLDLNWTWWWSLLFLFSQLLFLEIYHHLHIPSTDYYRARMFLLTGQLGKHLSICYIAKDPEVVDFGRWIPQRGRRENPVRALAWAGFSRPPRAGFTDQNPSHRGLSH